MKKVPTLFCSTVRFIQTINMIAPAFPNNEEFIFSNHEHPTSPAHGFKQGSSRPSGAWKEDVNVGHLIVFRFKDAKPDKSRGPKETWPQRLASEGPKKARPCGP